MSEEENLQLESLPPLPPEVDAKLRAIVNFIIDRVIEDQKKGVYKTND